MRSFLLVICLAAALPLTVAAWQNNDWETAAPESQGFDSAKLESLWAALAKRSTHALFIVRNDRLIFERYAESYSRVKPHGTASLAKALVGGDSLMFAMDEGRIKPDDLASKFVPQWANDPLKSKITIRQLATHTSGIEDAEADNQPHEQLTGWKGDFWKRLPPPLDPFTLGRDVAPVLDPPGTKARYSNPGMGMLAYCVTVSLRGAKDADIRSLIAHRLMEPIGVPAAEWSIGYGKPVRLEGMDVYANWGGAAFSPNAAARIGRLMMRKGDWDGKRIVPEELVKTMTTHAGLPNHSGLCWWVNREPDGSRVWKDAPADAFWGSGAGHQFLFVAPSLNLIAVRNGAALDAKADHNEALEKYIVTPLMQALASEAKAADTNDRKAAPSSSAGSSLPPSPVIKELRWAPKETILRRAKGSDNWPLTWGDDDALYAAYGDGNGFEPFVSEKLSLGFARIRGDAAAFQGENLRAPTLEQRGGGAAGRKASGLLCVDGALYLWARNAGNSQLAWSSDHGATWTWGNWKFTQSLGCPSFLNFGKNYAGARDTYVYVYSPDADSAYEVADRLILARVPKDRIREREAYEFFVKLDSTTGAAIWSKDLAQRGAAFVNPKRCYRSNVSYNAGLRRYLLAQPIPQAASKDAKGKIDTRFHGGLAIYDAPEPWGPWTTVFFTEDWDIGPGDSASLPPKWMSADGKTLYLVFSGEDSFSVRKATLR
ncbi:MAG: serine hydrolase [Candidatus Sumerlaeota bacterium]|nr:serine hydrolase [Candidatus Sumerlaeota bacterium]